jgi:hypothetical protein
MPSDGETDTASTIDTESTEKRPQRAKETPTEGENLTRGTRHPRNEDAAHKILRPFSVYHQGENDLKRPPKNAFSLIIELIKYSEPKNGR